MINSDYSSLNVINISEITQRIAEETSNPEEIVKNALGLFAQDPLALLNENVIEALKAIRSKNPIDYERLVTQAKGYKTVLNRLTSINRDNNDQNNIDIFIEKVKQSCELHHDADGRGIALINDRGIRKNYYVDSAGFSDWLRSKYFDEYRSGLSDFQLATIKSTLSAIGKFSGKEVTLHMRCAKYNGKYYIDLVNDQWQAICIDKNGWEIVDNVPVLFVRNKNMRKLPNPSLDADLESIWKHLNIPEKDRLRLLAWLIDSLRPETPYPILELIGEQGTAKSSTQSRLRGLIDPNKVDLRGCPKTSEDIYVAANNNHIVSFENISFLSPEQQDAICTISTGGGFATRQHYSNSEESVLETKRPLMINGINHVSTQPDMTERCVTIELPQIAMENRKDVSRLESEWQEDYPKIFSGVLNLFVSALAVLQTVNLVNKFRMADYQKLGEAVAQVQGYPVGHFSEIYGESVSEGIDRSLESYGISNAIQVLLANQANGMWEGTVLALKANLESLYGIDHSNWPKTPRGLSGQLKRIAPGLRSYGITIEHLGHTRDGSKLRILSSK